MSVRLPSQQLIRDIEDSEIDYMVDRMDAIRNRPGNPEGVEIQRFGNAVCFYSRTMPWATFNTVKGLTCADIGQIAPILAFYRERERKIQLEIVPSTVDQPFLKQLAEHGLYQSGFHASMFAEPSRAAGEDGTSDSSRMRIAPLREEQFELYATIHCRGTRLSDDGIPYVAANNRVLYHRPGWKYFIAYVDDVPAAVGVMYMHGGRASFTFATTLPEYRKQGLQQRLLNHRAQTAHDNGCRLAVSQCAFLSQSHRNMERVGMKLGYVRAAWTEI